MKTTSQAKLLSLAMLVVGTISSQAAISFDITSTNSNGDPDAPGTWFNVSLATNGDGTATFSIGNLVTTGNATKISQVYLGTVTSEGSGQNAVITNNFFSFFQSGTGAVGGTGVFSHTLTEYPNGQNVGGLVWDASSIADPAGTNDSNTINPGETLEITYNLVNVSTTEQNLIDGFNSNPQQLGIAFHAQALPGGYSEKYEATPRGPQDTPGVPDGGTTLAALGLSLLGLGSMRRFLIKKA